MHFEIVCDDANLERLIGRRTGELNTAQNGRSDAVFGEIYVKLPAGTPVYTVPNGRRLFDANATAHTVATGNNPGQPQPLASNATTAVDCYVGLRYAMGEGAIAQRGDVTVTTYREDDSVCGNRSEAEAEYNLYKRSLKISTDYPETGRPAPSAVYELLRFGRVINTANETLTPADVPHWRQIIIPTAAGASTQTGWVNLNNQGTHAVHVFSDADFPQWRGWQIFDDDTSADSRCDANGIKRFLDVDGDGNITPQERQTRMQDEGVRKKLRHAICSFPNEWNPATVDTHWAWLKTVTVENPEPLSDEDFTDFTNHLRALCFTFSDLVTAIRRFNPRGFIETFRKCSWLKLAELAATCPKHMFYHGNGNPRTAYTQAGNTYTLTLQTAIIRLTPYATQLNRCIGKYIGHSKQRIALFLSQVLLEAAQWKTHQTYRVLREYGYGTPNNAVSAAIQYYEAFFGRGIMQLTWAGNFKDYGIYKNIPNHQGAYIERRQNIQPRITATSQHYASEPRVTNPQTNQVTIDHTKLFQWSPRYDPDIISENDHYACDSGGFYWVSKNYPGITNNINRAADRAYSAANVKSICGAVNGGGNGYVERQAYSAYMLRYLTDDTSTSATVAIPALQGRPAVTANMSSPE
jgi:hypothetical protein